MYCQNTTIKEEILPKAKIVVIKDDMGNKLKDFPVAPDEDYKPEKEIEVNGKKYEYIGIKDEEYIYKEKVEISKGKANVQEKLPEATIVIIKDEKGNKLKDFPVDSLNKYTPEKEIEVDGKKYEYVEIKDKEYIYKEKVQTSKGDANAQEKLPEAKIVILKDNKGNKLKDFPISPEEDYKPEKEIEADGKKYEYVEIKDKEYVYKEKVENKEENKKEITQDSNKVKENTNKDNEEKITKNKEELPKTSSSLLGLLGLTAIFGTKRRKK